jgi:hypothetical protein
MSDSDVVVGHRSDRDIRMLQRPRHTKLFIIGLGLLASWFPVAFSGLVDYSETANPVVSLLSPHEELALVMLLLWGLPGIPLLVVGYYGWQRATPHS